MNRRLLVAVALLCTSLAACNRGPNKTASQTATPRDTTAAGRDMPVIESGKGTGPVTNVDAASLDPARAPEGERLFQGQCSQCHKLERRFIGPPLGGVTRRREPEWILNQMLDPEVMLNKDKLAKDMLGQYNAPMVNRHITRDEAESILIYLREHDAAEIAKAKAAPGDTSRAAVKH